MPKLFTIMGYKVFFWSNESGEPIHVHVCKGRTTENATKIWLTRNGGCILVNNNGNIPKAELKKLLKVISAQYFIIIDEWKKFFVTDDVKFYC